MLGFGPIASAPIGALPSSGITVTPAPTGTITLQSNPDGGQSQRFVGTTTNATSGSYTLTGSNGGTTVTGTFAITANAFDFTVSGIAAGDYAPVLTVTGSSVAGVTGTSSFSIIGIGGTPESPPPVTLVSADLVASYAISALVSADLSATYLIDGDQVPIFVTVAIMRADPAVSSGVISTAPTINTARLQ